MDKFVLILNLSLLAAVFVAAIATVAVRYEERRLQIALAQEEKLGHKLTDYSRRLNIEIAARTDFAELYRAALDERGFTVPGIADSSLIFLEPETDRATR